MIKIALAQLNYIIGDFTYNQDLIVNTIEKCKENNADLVVFSEMAVCGTPVYSLVERKDFIEKSQDSLRRIAEKCDTISAIIGCPSVEGDEIYNSVYYVKNKSVTKVANKPISDFVAAFDEYSIFGNGTETIDKNIYINNTELVVVFSDPNNIHNKQLIEDKVKTNKNVLVVNVGIKPFEYETYLETENNINGNLIAPYIKVNSCGAQTEFVYHGGSFAMNTNGETAIKLKLFESDVDYVLFNEDENCFEQTTRNPYHVSDIELIHDALVTAIRDYFYKTKQTRCILGLSGGLDSAVVYALAAEAIGIENVYGVLLPSEFSTEHSIKDAIDLANNLGGKYDIISIKDTYNSFMQNLTPLFQNKPFNVAEENIQARIRMVYLMALANKHNYLLLNTSNKSESAVGYGTMYGDTCGAMSVLGDVYKTQVYQLANYINRDKEIIPQNTITKPPSAELRNDQKDSDSLPNYDVLDAILYQFIENNKSIGEIISKGYNEETVKRIVRLVKISEWKRRQTPPSIKISKKHFGSDRKIAINSNYSYE